jgi:hypothetical protein
MFDTFSATVFTLHDNIAVTGQNHIHTWMKPHPHIDTKSQNSLDSSWKQASRQILRCHHFVTAQQTDTQQGAYHISRRLTRVHTASKGKS